MDASPPPPLPPTNETDELQFATAEPGRPRGGLPEMPPVRTCIGCRRPIESVYYALNDKAICPSCREQIAAPPKGSGTARFLMAAGKGLVAGIIGAAIWYAIRRVAQIEIGLVAVLVGYMVGKTIRAASGNRGGREYQILAVVITYCCIAGNILPYIIEAWNKYRPGQPIPPALYLRFFWGAMQSPVRHAAESPIRILIIGFALWEAWKLTRGRNLPITGPYNIAPPVDGVIV